MSYRCLDCSNSASKKFPGGKCPACGSYNVKSDFAKIRYAEKEKPKKTLIEILVMSGLWGLLLYGVWDRFFSG